MSTDCPPMSSSNRCLRVLCGLLMLGVVGCGKHEPEQKSVARWEMFAAPLMGEWVEAAMEHSGGIQKQEGGFVMEAGEPMTGIVFPAWKQHDLPLIDYVITYEAMRVSGNDMFGAVTFPVSTFEESVSFVLGGWGGKLIGISSIDGEDASMNSTGSSQRLEGGQWHRVRIEVSRKTLSVHLDGRPVINTSIVGRTLTMRPGEIVNCLPFGFATYGTEGRVRNCVVERLSVP